MVHVENGDVKLEGDFDYVVGEVCVALKVIYDEAKKRFPSELVEEWLDDLPVALRITEEEMIEDIYERMMDDEC